MKISKLFATQNELFEGRTTFYTVYAQLPGSAISAEYYFMSVAEAVPTQFNPGAEIDHIDGSNQPSLISFSSCNFQV